MQAILDRDLTRCRRGPATPRTAAVYLAPASRPHNGRNGAAKDRGTRMRVAIYLRVSTDRQTVENQDAEPVCGEDLESLRSQDAQSVRRQDAEPVSRENAQPV